MKGRKGRSLRNGTLILMAVVLLLSIAACSSARDSSSAKSDSDFAKMARSERAASQPMAEAVPSASVSLTSAESDIKAASVQIASAGTGGGIGPIADANAGYGRKVIYRAELVMKVERFKTAEEQLMNLIHLSGAFVLQFSDSRNEDEVGATYVIKVPSEGFSSFLEKLQKIESLKFEREVNGNDVTEEYVDLDARLNAKKTVEARLLSFMDKATKTDDLLKYSNQLAQVQEEIEQIKGRIRYLDQNVTFSTVNLRLYQSSGIELVKNKPQDEKAFGQRLGDALSGSAKVLRQFGEWLLVIIAALLPVLAVVAVIGLPTYVIARKRSATRKIRLKEERKAWNKPFVATEQSDAPPKNEALQEENASIPERPDEKDENR
ncbi:DUF4349 domain-containing protein [Cohnella terricola]|uniref:DUF4349 domain-containing protein n=1 Tax=Cohnella terricola TaxID=1289167 RepID=A0A559JL22_9BACL|nr:DUF4349 domain-containing protein [Cohnella terricola]TVY00573.1 DUF4349 domain-containing protein [Cohnella terricola]